MQIHEWLQGTKAGQVMVRQVVTLAADEILAQAAGLFLREQISGAPVVDAAGRCLGVLSVSDVVGAEEKVAVERAKMATSGLFSSGLALPVSVYEDELARIRDKIVPAAEQPVRRFMTADLVSVPADEPLGQVVRRMVDAHIHRVVVLDNDSRLLGLITTTDILAALLRAAG
jgi:CBS domain-containing protein